MARPPPAPVPVNGPSPLTAPNHHHNQPPPPSNTARYCPHHAIDALGGSGTGMPAAAHAYKDNSDVALRWLSPAGRPPPPPVPLPLLRLSGVGGETYTEPEERQVAEAAVPVRPPAEQPQAAPNDPEPPTPEGVQAGKAAPAAKAAVSAALPPEALPMGKVPRPPPLPAMPRPAARRCGEGRARADPGRFAADRHGCGRRQGGRQVPRPHQAQPHPQEPPKAVPAQGRLPRGKAGRPSTLRRASRCCSCSSVWSRRGQTPIRRRGVQVTGARGRGRRATEGGRCAEEGDKRQRRAEVWAAVPGDGHKGRARALAATREGRGTGRATMQAAAGEDSHTGQARARAAEGGTQGTARSTGRGTGRTRVPAERAKARLTRDTGRGPGRMEHTTARGWRQGGSPGKGRGRVTPATMGRQDGPKGRGGKERADDRGRAAGRPRSQKSRRYVASPPVSSRCRRTTPTTITSPVTTSTPT